ncbi:hypothetical protein JCM11251_005926 [Rhodosporidiobolus azoricus]
MATLSARHEQVAAVAHTKRLLWGASAVGLVALAGSCAVHLPWGILDTQGRIVGFALLAVSDFVWMTSPLAAFTYLGYPKRMNTMWWMLILFNVLHAVTATLLVLTLFQNKQKFIDECVADSAITDCELRVKTLSIAQPIVAAFLPIAGGFVLSALWRSFSALTQDQRYASLYGGDETAAVPPGWHTPPAVLAPDSSASESEDEDVHGRRAAGRDTPPKGSMWFEMGKKGSGGEGRRAGRQAPLSWSDVRKARKEKNLSRAGNRS